MKKSAWYSSRHAAAFLLALAFLILLFPSASRAVSSHILFIAPFAGNAKINGTTDYYGVAPFDYATHADKTYAALTGATPAVISYDASPLKQEIIGTASATQMYYFQLTIYPANFDAAYASFGSTYDTLAGVMINDISAFDAGGAFVQTTDVFAGNQYRYFNDFSDIDFAKPTILQFIAPATLNLHFLKDKSAAPLHVSFHLENLSAPGANDLTESSGIVLTLTNLGPVPAFSPIAYDYGELNSAVDFYLANYRGADYVDNSAKTDFEAALHQAANMKTHRNVTAAATADALIATLDQKAGDLIPISTLSVNYATLQLAINNYVADHYVDNAKRTAYESLRLAAGNLIASSGAKSQLAADVYFRKLNFALAQLTPHSSSGLDVTQLKTELAKPQYANYQSANYMSNQYSNRTQFETTLNRAKVIIGATPPSPAATPQEITQLLTALPAQLAALIDQSALRTAVETTYKSFNKDLFADNPARTAFITALTAAQTMYTSATAMNQNELNAIVSPLANLYAALTPNSDTVTLKDSATGVQVSGKIAQNAKLTVTANALHPQNTCAACDEIHRLLTNGKVLALYDISLSQGFEGNLTVSIPVKPEFNGKLVSILHCKQNKLEVKEATVTGGAASGLFSALSPFAVVEGRYTPSTGDKDTGGYIRPPHVGDDTYWEGWPLLFPAAAIALAAKFKSNEKKNSKKKKDKE